MVARSSCAATSHAATVNRKSFKQRKSEKRRVIPMRCCDAGLRIVNGPTETTENNVVKSGRRKVIKCLITDNSGGLDSFSSDSRGSASILPRLRL